MKWITWMMVIMVGCSGGSTPQSREAPRSEVYRQFFQVGFSHRLLTKESRLVGFVEAGRRATIIQPNDSEEIMSFEVSPPHVVFPLPEYSGIAAVDQQNLSLKEPQGSVTFRSQVPGRFGFAGGSLAFAWAGDNALQIIRQKRSLEWQDIVLDLPWVTGQVSEGENAVPSAVPLWSQDGETLLVFSPVDGRHQFYKVQGNDDMAASGEVCEGDGIGTGAAPSFRDAFWWEGGQQFVFGNARGQVYLRDPNEACGSFTTLKQITLPQGYPIIRLMGQEGILFVMQSGKITEMALGEDLTITRETSGLCAYPTLVNRVDDGRLLVQCLRADVINAPEVVPINVNLLNDFRDLILYQAGSGEELDRQQIRGSLLAGFGVDHEAGVAFILMNSSFGVLQRWNLKTLEKTEAAGFFLDGLFD